MTTTEGVRTVVVATDGSRSSQGAVSFAVELAADHGWQIDFVHVIPTIDVEPGFGLCDAGAALPHIPTERDHALLDEAAKVAANHGVATSSVLLGGATAPAIVEYAESSDADMIVVGSHGHGPVAGVLLGSVSLGVLAGSKRPVLIVRRQ